MKAYKSMLAVAGLAVLSLGCAKAGPQGGAAPEAIAAAHHDHGSRRGGTVLMNGDVHVEIVPDFAGKHAVLFSDAHRRPLPVSSIQEATLTVLRDGEAPEVLGLRPQDDGTWTASGRPIDGPGVTLRFTYRAPGAGEPYSIDLPVEAPPAKHAHAH